MDDLERQFREFYEKTRRTLSRLPVLAAQDAVNFFQDSFRRQAWIGDTTEPWPARKSDKTRRDAGRAILVKSGRLKRSVRKIKADWDAVIVGTSLPYAKAHNEGLNEQVQVKTHVRKVSSRNTRVSTGGRRSQRTSTGIAFVSGHNRKMRMPRRQFLGESQWLNRKIERTIIRQLRTL